MYSYPLCPCYSRFCSFGRHIPPARGAHATHNLQCCPLRHIHRPRERPSPHPTLRCGSSADASNGHDNSHPLLAQSRKAREVVIYSSSLLSTRLSTRIRLYQPLHARDAAGLRVDNGDHTVVLRAGDLSPARPPTSKLPSNRTTRAPYTSRKTNAERTSRGVEFDQR
jgi:hypothetical protein